MSQRDTAGEHSRGTAYAFLAYGLWGLFPLYFHGLKPAGEWEILAHRILWTLAACLLVLVIRRDWRWLRELARQPKVAGALALAALLIAVNWVIYVFAVLTGRTYEAALGYFLNPLVTVALGVLVLRERLRPLQWLAVAVGAIAAVDLTVAGGPFPWISLTLAFSFGLYGLLKNRIGVSVAPLHSLAAETLVLALPAVGIVLIVGARAETTFGQGAEHTLLLALAGIITAVPLLLFAAAARRVPLVTIGLIQFITPVMQLLVGVWWLGEQVSTALWIGFGIVWIALVLLSSDSLLAARRGRRSLAAAEPGLEA
ncbi:MAG: EamA family transporter RarD [Tetrasphaera sp.]